MTGKSFVFALAAGLLLPAAAPTTARAFDGAIQVLHGLPVAEALTVSRNEGGTPVTVVRGSPAVPAAPATTAPVTVIDGAPLHIDALEPTGNWFLDRSGDDLVVVHCYTRQSAYVGGGRKIRCDAERL